MKSRTTAEPSPKGIYANYFEVGHTAFEIVIDFGQRYGSTTPPCHTRIVTSPIYAQALLEILRESLEQYVAAFGPLRDSGERAGASSDRQGVKAGDAAGGENAD